MKKLFTALLMTTVMVGTLGAFSGSATAGMLDSDDFTNEQLATIKVPITDAIVKAKEVQGGTVIKAELEREDGKLVYEIEFLDDGEESEVIVDALSGKAMLEED